MRPISSTGRSKIPTSSCAEWAGSTHACPKGSVPLPAPARCRSAWRATALPRWACSPAWTAPACGPGASCGSTPTAISTPGRRRLRNTWAAWPWPCSRGGATGGRVAGTRCRRSGPPSASTRIPRSASSCAARAISIRARTRRCRTRKWSAAGSMMSPGIWRRIKACTCTGIRTSWTPKGNCPASSTTSSAARPARSWGGCSGRSAASGSSPFPCPRGIRRRTAGNRTASACLNLLQELLGHESIGERR